MDIPPSALGFSFGGACAPRLLPWGSSPKKILSQPYNGEDHIGLRCFPGVSPLALQKDQDCGPGAGRDRAECSHGAELAQAAATAGEAQKNAEHGQFGVLQAVKENQERHEADDTPSKAGEGGGREERPGVTAAERAAGRQECSRNTSVELCHQEHHLTCVALPYLPTRLLLMPFPIASSGGSTEREKAELLESAFQSRCLAWAEFSLKSPLGHRPVSSSETLRRRPDPPLGLGTSRWLWVSSGAVVTETEICREPVHSALTASVPRRWPREDAQGRQQPRDAPLKGVWWLMGPERWMIYRKLCRPAACPAGAGERGRIGAARRAVPPLGFFPQGAAGLVREGGKNGAYCYCLVFVPSSQLSRKPWHGSHTQLVLLQLLTCYVLLIHSQKSFSTPPFVLACTAPFTVHSRLPSSVLPSSDVDRDTGLFLRIIE